MSVNSSVTDFSPLDEPIWQALSTTHACLAVGDDHAKRYPTDIGPLSGMKDQSAASYRSLAQLMSADDVAVLFLRTLPSPPEGWQIVTAFPMEQMVCDTPPAAPDGFAIEPLSKADVQQMRALAQATEPGPFRKRTIELGGYRGIRDAGRLVSMSGQRISLTGFTEVSAVCTYPEYRGRGYAGALVAAVARSLFEHNITPFLGVRQDNAGAISVYQRVGFRIRRTLYVVVLKRPQ